MANQQSQLRSSAGNPPMTTASYPSPRMANNIPPGNSMSLMNNSMMPPPPQYPHNNNNNNNNSNGQKFPPALLPVNGTQRYFTPGSDVIDLSSPPHSPQQRQIVMNGKQPSPQPAHVLQRPSSSPKLPPKQDDSDGWHKLIPIMETPMRANNIPSPFKMQKALVGGKMVPCINAKPHVYSELLMTVNDLMEQFFPQVSMAKCKEVLQNVLQVNLYSGNTQMKTVLREGRKCKSLSDVVPLIQLKDVMQYMPQLRYVMEGGGGGGESAAKRQRLQS